MRTTRYRTGGGSGGGSVECTPTAVWTDTFGMDDFLQIIYSLPFLDTFALTEGGLGILVGLMDSLGIDDRLALAQIATASQDTFGVDDQLTLVTLKSFLLDTFAADDALVVVIKNYFADTFGMDDSFSLGVQGNFADEVEVSDGALGIAIKLFQTLGVDDRLTFVDLLTTYADTFGMDDRLTLATVMSTFADTVGLDDSLTLADIALYFQDTFGVDDSLFVDLLTDFIDTFGLDDRLTLATLKTTFLDTFGATENFFVDSFTNQPNIFDLTEDALGVKPTLFDTVGATDDLVPDFEAIWTESTIQHFDYKGGSLGLPESLQIADSVAVSITGNIDIAIALIETDWSPAGFPISVAKWGVAGTRSWIFQFDGSGTGAVIFQWSADGTATLNNGVSSVPGFTDGGIGALRITFNASNRVISYYKKTSMTAQQVADGGLVDALSNWTLMNSTTAGASTSIFDSTSPISFGSQSGGVNPTNKQILGCAIRNGIEGTLVVDYRAADATSPYETVLERANNASVAITGNLARGDESRYAPVLGQSDVFTRATIANWTCGRSGTPDNDPCGDGWIDQANATTNHGNESPLIVKGKSTLANDERRAFVKFQMSRFADLVAYVGGTHTFTVRVTNTNTLIAAVFTLQVWRVVANPFTESTLTWNVPVAGGPTAGVMLASTAPSIPANTTQDVTVTLSDANVDSIFSSGSAWVYLRMTGPTAATPITFNVVSREGATVADRPTFELELRR